MPNTANAHLVAANAVELRGFEYAKYATVTAMNLVTGRPGEICTVTATGVDYQWNQTLTAWVPWHNNGSVLRANITGAATANVAGRGAAELTLTGNVTGLTISGWSTDNTIVQRVRFQIKQDTTGGRSFAWESVNGVWLESPPSALDVTPSGSTLQFYAITTDGGATVWLEPVGIGYANPCIYMQLVETAIPAVTAGTPVTINHSYQMVYGVELVEVATGRRVIADWYHTTPGDESSSVTIDFTATHPANTYTARVAGLAATPCSLTVTSSEWVSIQLGLTAATTIDPTVTWAGGAAGRVQWVWGDGSAPENATSGVALPHTYASAYTGNATLRWRRGTNITILRTSNDPWTYSLATAANGLPTLSTLSAFNGGATITGDLAVLSVMPSLLAVTLHNNPGLTGDIGALPRTILGFSAENCGYGGDLSGITGMSLVTFVANNTSVTGNLSSISAMTTLTNLQLNDTTVTGDVSSLAAMTGMVELRLGSTNVSGNINTAVNAMPNLTQLEYNSVAINPTQAELDTLIGTLAGRATVNGELRIAGSNPAITNTAGVTTLQGRGWSVFHN